MIPLIRTLAVEMSRSAGAQPGLIRQLFLRHVPIMTNPTQVDRHDFLKVHHTMGTSVGTVTPIGARWHGSRCIAIRSRIAERSRTCWQSHLARGQWVTKIGYRKILEQAVAEARSEQR